MGSFPNGLPLGMFGWSKYKILPVYGEKRPIHVHTYLDTKIYTFIYTKNECYPFYGFHLERG